LKEPAHYLWEVSEVDAVRIAADIARTFWYFAELDRHPVFRWAKAQGLHMPLLELAQHYGMVTPLLDLSESIEVALFFATHRFRDGQFEPCSSGTGVLYIIDRTTMPPAFASRFTPIAIQPFPRPTQQWGWTCELFMGECFEAYPWLGGLVFEHSEALADRIRSMAEAGGPLFPPDALASIAATVRASKVLPIESVEAAAKHLKSAFPVGRFGTVLHALEAAGYSISDSVPVVMSDELAIELEPVCQAAIAAWKAAAANRMGQLCVRHGRDGRQLEYGILTPPTSDGGEWTVVPAPQYYSAFEPLDQRTHNAAAPECVANN